jgi:N-acetylneuraminic acid mutarotase
MAKYQLILEKVSNTDPETIPLPRSGHRCATDGIFLYSFGGFNPRIPGKLFTKNIWCFHLTSKRWYNIMTNGDRFDKVPTCVASSTMVLHKGRFIVFGGSGYPFGSTNSNRTFEFDPREQMWRCFSVMPEVGDIVPTAGYGQGVVMDSDDCMFIFGGTRGLDYNNDLYKFNLKTHRWEYIRCNEPPLARYRHEMVGIDGGFIVIGGYGQNGACPLDKLPLYSYADCSWKEVSCEEDPDHGFPKARRAHGCVKFKDNVYVSGGLDKDDGETMYDDIWMLNVETFSWLKIPQVELFTDGN